MTRLGNFCLGYGMLVGGFLFLLLLVGTQAARSLDEAMLAVLLGLVAPAPTLLAGLLLRRAWRTAPIACLAITVGMTLLVAHVWRRPQPSRAMGALSSALFNVQYSQLYFLPCTLTIAVIIVARAAMARFGQPSDIGV